MATNERIEQKIEESLMESLDKELTQEQITLLESKVTTVRKLASTD